MVSRAEFVQAIRDFKKTYHGKLKDILRGYANPEAIKAFWANPIIHAYLARPSVTFTDKHPLLQDSKTKAEHDTTDHYELKVYQYLPNAVVYRDNDITTPKFYTSGTRYHLDVFKKLFKTFCQDSDDIEVAGPYDIYVCAQQTYSSFLTFEGEKTAPRFLIQANWKDEHASTCITVLDPITHHALITFFINSSHSEAVYEHLKERFLTEQQTSLSNLPETDKAILKSYLAKTFSIDIDDDTVLSQPPTLFKNQEEKAAFALNYSSADYHSKAYAALVDGPDIETIYLFGIRKSFGRSFPNLSIKHTAKTPFVDASHHLQQAADDQNCVLYSMNFIQALTEMLKQPAVADRVFELACAIKTSPTAMEDLVHIFQEDLKADLPCYYDAVTKASKSPTALEDFHLQQRWEIGGKSLSLLHPLEETKAISSAAASASGFFSEQPTDKTAAEEKELNQTGDAKEGLPTRGTK
jgi:hypothetical protein